MPPADAPTITAVLVRPEGEYRFPDGWRRVMGWNDLGLWVDDSTGSTGIIRPVRRPVAMGIDQPQVIEVLPQVRP